MGKRVFDNPTLRAWWLVHIEAWQKSGDTLTKYCRVHRINIERFRRWRREITDWEAQKSERSARRKKHWKPLSPDKRRRATQAYWAMHVEAWIWSGMPLRDYSAALRVSSHSLSRWRKIFESEEITIDWRAMLHPAARAAISTKIEPSAKEKAEAARLTEAIEAEAPPPRRAVRRRWTTEEKIAILLQAERHGSTISSVGHAHGISTSVLFRWRDQLGMGKEKPMTIMPVRVIEPRDRNSTGPASLLADLLPCPDGMKEVELADGRRVFAPADADPDAVRRAITEREQRP